MGDVRANWTFSASFLCDTQDQSSPSVHSIISATDSATPSKDKKLFVESHVWAVAVKAAEHKVSAYVLFKALAVTSVAERYKQESAENVSVCAVFTTVSYVASVVVAETRTTKTTTADPHIFFSFVCAMSPPENNKHVPMEVECYAKRAFFVSESRDMYTNWMVASYGKKHEPFRLVVRALLFNALYSTHVYFGPMPDYEIMIGYRAYLDHCDDVLSKKINAPNVTNHWIYLVKSLYGLGEERFRKQLEDSVNDENATFVQQLNVWENRVCEMMIAVDLVNKKTIALRESDGAVELDDVKEDFDVKVEKAKTKYATKKLLPWDEETCSADYFDSRSTSVSRMNARVEKFLAKDQEEEEEAPKWF